MYLPINIIHVNILDILDLQLSTGICQYQPDLKHLKIIYVYEYLLICPYFGNIRQPKAHLRSGYEGIKLINYVI